MNKPKLLIFASGTATGGGSGFENLVQASRKILSLDSARGNARQPRELDAEIIGVVSNNEYGGVRERADRLGIPFIHFASRNYSQILKNLRIDKEKEGLEFETEEYRRIVRESGAEWVMLSGWLKFVHGLDPRRTFNIHPALLSFDHGRFGGPGLYGRRVHEAVSEALSRGEITESGFSMHFVTDEYDRGPVFFEHRVPLKKGMTTEEVAQLVNEVEHEWQPRIANMVVHGEISWDGNDPASLIAPRGYAYLPRETS